jgi:hypothetical protein
MINSTHSKFRNLREHTFYPYRSCVFRYMALVVRYMLWKKQGKTTKLGKLRPKLTPGLVALFNCLYDVLLRGEDATIASIAPVAHKILYDTFTLRLDPCNPVDSAFEQSVAFSMLKPTVGQYLSANELTRYLSFIQRSAFSTLVHVARLGGPEVPYHLVERDVIDGCWDEDDCTSDVTDDEVEQEQLVFGQPGEGLGDSEDLEAQLEDGETAINPVGDMTALASSSISEDTFEVTSQEESNPMLR